MGKGNSQRKEAARKSQKEEKMISPYHSIIEYDDDDWQEYLEQILLIDIFMPVILTYTDTDTLKRVIRYIVYAYSPDSDKIILNTDWHTNKIKIYEFVLAKPLKEIYEDLVLLKNPAVVETAHRWMEFVGNDTFKQMQILKDLRVEMQLSSLTKIEKSSGECDYDQKYKNANYASELKKKINDLEAELIQNNQKLKAAHKEVKLAKAKFTVGPESFSK